MTGNARYPRKNQLIALKENSRVKSSNWKWREQFKFEKMRLKEFSKLRKRWLDLERISLREMQNIERSRDSDGPESKLSLDDAPFMDRGFWWAWLISLSGHAQFFSHKKNKWSRKFIHVSIYRFRECLKTVLLMTRGDMITYESTNSISQSLCHISIQLLHIIISTKRIDVE